MLEDERAASKRRADIIRVLHSQSMRSRAGRVHPVLGVLAAVALASITRARTSFATRTETLPPLPTPPPFSHAPTRPQMLASLLLRLWDSPRTLRSLERPTTSRTTTARFSSTKPEEALSQRSSSLCVANVYCGGSLEAWGREGTVECALILPLCARAPSCVLCSRPSLITAAKPPSHACLAFTSLDAQLFGRCAICFLSVPAGVAPRCARPHILCARYTGAPLFTPIPRPPSDAAFSIFLARCARTRPCTLRRRLHRAAPAFSALSTDPLYSPLHCSLRTLSFERFARTRPGKQRRPSQRAASAFSALSPGTPLFTPPLFTSHPSLGASPAPVLASRCSRIRCPFHRRSSISSTPTPRIGRSDRVLCARRAHSRHHTLRHVSALRTHSLRASVPHLISRCIRPLRSVPSPGTPLQRAARTFFARFSPTLDCSLRSPSTLALCAHPLRSVPSPGTPLQRAARTFFACFSPTLDFSLHSPSALAAHARHATSARCAHILRLLQFHN
jgi:hypothetical protein